MADPVGIQFGHCIVEFVVAGCRLLESAEIAEVLFTSVPEPSTWAMMLLGFAGLACLGWRRGAKQHARALRRDRIAGVTFRQAACGRPVPESRAVRATVAEVYFVNRCKYLVHVV
jgi:hypothetical protein